MKNKSFWRNTAIFLLPVVVFNFSFVEFSYSQISVKGSVKGICNNVILDGVNVRIKGTKTVVNTNKNGYYSINCKHSYDTLVFSYVGYLTFEQSIGNDRLINVILEEDPVVIDEIIIINHYKPKNTGVLTGKPVIYLYPEKEEVVNLKIKYSGIMKTTYPLYNNGWEVTAFPAGKIINHSDGMEYSYLFWDGVMTYSDEQTTYSNGFVVSKDSALFFLQRILPQTGLKPTEYNEFIVYWLPYLQENKYTFIHFRTDEDYNTISENIVIPKPDIQIRVFMEFKEVDSFFQVEEQIFSKPIRTGFVLVEWGGSHIDKPIKIKDLKNEFVER